MLARPLGSISVERCRQPAGVLCGAPSTKKRAAWRGPFFVATTYSGTGMARAIVAEICPASGVVGFEPLHAVRNCISVDGSDGNGVSGTWRAVHDRARRRRVRTGVVIGVIAVIGRCEGAADHRAGNKSCTYTAPAPSAAIPPAAATPSAPPLHDLHAGRELHS